MKKHTKFVTTGLLSVSLVFAGSGAAMATPPAVAAESVRQPAPFTAVEAAIPKFWSSIFKLFMQFTKHASKQATARGISQATVKKVLNEGKVIQRQNGTATTQLGNTRVVVNVKNGNIITVYKAGGGGFSGGH